MTSAWSTDSGRDGGVERAHPKDSAARARPLADAVRGTATGVLVSACVLAAAFLVDFVTGGPTVHTSTLSGIAWLVVLAAAVAGLGSFLWAMAWAGRSRRLQLLQVENEALRRTLDVAYARAAVDAGLVDELVHLHDVAAEAHGRALPRLAYVDPATTVRLLADSLAERSPE